MINKPNILENLGAIRIIVTDKTGTLTTSRLILRSIFCQGKLWGICEKSTQVNDQGYQIPDKENQFKIMKHLYEAKFKCKFHELFMCVILCHSARFSVRE